MHSQWIDEWSVGCFVVASLANMFVYCTWACVCVCAGATIYARKGRALFFNHRCLHVSPHELSWQWGETLIELNTVVQRAQRKGRLIVNANLCHGIVKCILSLPIDPIKSLFARFDLNKWPQCTYAEWPIIAAATYDDCFFLSFVPQQCFLISDEFDFDWIKTAMNER